MDTKMLVTYLVISGINMEENVLDYLEIESPLLKIMADYRNHRRFILRCIKVRITPFSCSLKNPLNSCKGYHIIHKAEKQCLYERVRNINKTLYLYEK